VKARDPSFAKRYGRVAGLLLLLALVLAVGYWLYSMFSTPAKSTRKRAVQEIALIKPPPPPPPPKTPPPPPPKQEQEKIDVPKPEAMPDKPSEAPPPGPDLAIDAAGSGSGDGFGLVGKPGGTDLLATGGGTVGSRFAWYSALVKERIQDAVIKDKKLRSATNYQRQVHVWINSAGAVTRVELIGPGDNPNLDDALRQALRNVAAVREGAPSDMPQPIKLRIYAQS